MLGSFISYSNRPNTSFVVSIVSQFLNAPCDSHWDVVIRILRYIKSARESYFMKTKGNTQVVVYFNADWAGSLSDRRSTSGYSVFGGGNVISWRSKKRKKRYGNNNL